MVKLLVFLIIFLGVIPLGVILARMYPVFRLVFFCMMVFFTSSMLAIHIYPIPDWTGTARGFALTTVDISSAIVLLSMLADPKCKISFAPRGAWFYGLYFITVLLSGIDAVYLPQWGFEIVKMIWMYIFFLAAYNFFINSKKLWPLVYTICGTLFFMLLVGLYQKYLTGMYYQIPSTLPHQNSLALYVSLFGALLLGILLNEKMNRLQALLVAAGQLSTVLLIIFTYSRGGLFCYFIGCAVVVFFTLIFNGITRRQILFTLLGLAGALILLGYAAPRIIQRFQNAPVSSKTTRINLAKAAVRIANGHYLFGVGANNFSAYTGPHKAYAREQFEGMIIHPGTEDFGAIVETTYLLVAAEGGWISLAMLLIWYGYYFIRSFGCLRYLRNAPCFGVSVGIFGGLCANYLQSLIEWVLKQYCNFYQLMLIFALTAAVWTTRQAIRKNSVIMKKAVPGKNGSAAG